MTQKIILDKKDINMIKATADNFPVDTKYELVYDISSGFGYTIDLVIKDIKVNNGTINGDFVVHIVDESSW
jgi:hypothetical protein